MTVHVPRLQVVKLIPLIFVLPLIINAECPKSERLLKDDMWCVNDDIVPNYVFDGRDPSIKIQTKNNGIFKFNLHDVKTAVDKNLSFGRVRAEILGYNPPSIHEPHAVTIFVAGKERKENLDREIEKTRKVFRGRCFHCVLSEKPAESR